MRVDVYVQGNAKIGNTEKRSFKTSTLNKNNGNNGCDRALMKSFSSLKEGHVASLNG